MTTIELTPFHLTALLKFNGQRALTETGLAKALNCEKAVSRHAITVLKATGLIKSLGAYEFTITPDGSTKLIENKQIAAKAEPKPRKISTVTEAVSNMVSSESEALKEIMKDTPASLVLVVPPEQAGSVTAQEWAGKPYSDLAKDLEGVSFSSARPTELPALDLNAPEEDPKPDPQPSFAELVRRGLDRLNKQLNHSPVTIENKRQKLEMLTSLADTLDGFDRNLSASLREVATDINKLQEATHG